MLSCGVKGPLLRDKNFINEKNDNNYVEFNCLENVIKLAQSGQKYFDYIVLSTWESDFDFISLENNFFDKVIISNEKYFEKIYLKNNIFNQNYKKQFHTIKMASNFLKNKDLDFIVKIRTDLFVNVQELYQECLYALNKKTILINNGIRDKKRFLELDDFIFGSESNFFLDWMGNLMNIEFKNWGGAHHRLMMSYLWTKYKNSFKFREILFFHKDIVNNSKSISKKAIKEWSKFHILDEEFWKDSQLRGEDLDTRYYDFEPVLPLLEKHKIKYNFRLFFKWFVNKDNI
tara:strand:+ start:3155 stop:4018 length:864 start_codon:yes stop_codon:yes gene_type:complete